MGLGRRRMPEPGAKAPAPAMSQLFVRVQVYGELPELW